MTAEVLRCQVGTPLCGGHAQCAACNQTVCLWPEGGLRMHWPSGRDWLIGNTPCVGSERSKDEFLNDCQELLQLGDHS